VNLNKTIESIVTYSSLRPLIDKKRFSAGNYANPTVTLLPNTDLALLALAINGES
jgi:hypothetical protein